MTTPDCHYTYLSSSESSVEDSSNSHHHYDGNHHHALAVDAHSQRIKTIRNASVMLGFLVGLFVQLSTMGANFIALVTLGEDIAHTGRHQIIEYSFMWSLVSSMLAVTVLTCLRALLAAVFGHTLAGHNDDDDDDDAAAAQKALEDLLVYMQNRFVVGALLGVCIAWAATDLLMGIPLEVFHSVIALVVAWMWCQAPALQRFTRPTTSGATRSKKTSNNKKQDDQPLFRGAMLV